MAQNGKTVMHNVVLLAAPDSALAQELAVRNLPDIHLQVYAPAAVPEVVLAEYSAIKNAYRKKYQATFDLARQMYREDPDGVQTYLKGLKEAGRTMLAEAYQKGLKAAKQTNKTKGATSTGIGQMALFNS